MELLYGTSGEDVSPGFGEAREGRFPIPDVRGRKSPGSKARGSERVSPETGDEPRTARAIPPPLF